MMENIFTELNRRFRIGSILAKYIYINAGVYLIIQVMTVFMKLFLKEPSFLIYLKLPSSWQALRYCPWTIFTYMFVHFEFLHILFNMLWLYWFGKIFLQFFNGRQLGGLYVLGGLTGGAFYIIAFNLFPFFREVVDSSTMIGASASVMAIVFAISFSQMDYRLNLFIFGRIKLMYLALGVFFIDLFAITSQNNAGGHIAHIGGATLGLLFAMQYRKGKDITRFINRIIDGFVNFFSRKPTFRVHKNKTCQAPPPKNSRPETDDAYHRRKNEETQEIDRILDKLKHSGYESLSTEEKKRLFNASKS
jgi:membrane associated rhomboid family serine protease